MEQLKVVESARLGVLLDHLASELSQRPLRDPFAPEMLCVSSRSMREALEFGLAERLGICANVSFPFPGEALGRLLTQMEGGEAGDGDAWAGDSLVWAVHAALVRALSEPDAAAAYAPVIAWLGGGVAGGAEAGSAAVTQRRLHALADNVGRLFERYIVHRPSMVLGWAQGDDIDGRGDKLPAALTWQVDLFRRVRGVIGAARPNLAERVARLAGAPGWQSTNGPERIAFFAVATMPGLFLDALRVVSRQVPTTLYLLTPSATYLGELRGSRGEGQGAESSNPLLVAFGRPAMVLQTLCLERELDVGGGVLDELASPTSLLGALQDGVYRNVAPEVDERLLRTGHIDEPLLRLSEHASASIEIHGCAGEVRQAEVLRDVLLRRLGADTSLEPRDIVVAVPDVTEWYPLLAAVLDEGGRDGRVASDGLPPALPWRVTDVALRAINPVAQGLLAVFAMRGSRRSVDELIAFLRLPVVRARFGLAEADVLRMHELLAQAGARWGSEPHDRGTTAGGPDALGTWDVAFDRLLLGVLSSDEDADWGGVAPMVDAWGDRTTVARAAVATNELRHWLDEVGRPRSVSGWVALLRGDDRQRGLVDALFAPGAGDFWSLGQVLDAIGELETAAEPMGEEPIVPEIVADWLIQVFDRGAQAGEKLPGGVTVTSLRQARGLAPRVLVVLGADAAIFPRQGPPSAWDLIALSHRATDLTARDEDRAIFFDLLMGARDAFIVLYDNCDPTDRSPRPMATPVADLAAAAVQALMTPAASPELRAQLAPMLSVSHPLTRHAPQAFVGGVGSTGAIWSHDTRQLKRARQVLTRRSGAEPVAQHGLFVASAGNEPLYFQRTTEASVRFDVERIAELLYHPARWQLRQALGLYGDELELPHDGEVLPLAFADSSPFVLRGISERLLSAMAQVRSRCDQSTSPLRAAMRAAMEAAASGSGADTSALVQAVCEALIAEQAMPVLRRSAYQAIAKHVDAVVLPLLGWLTGSEDRPAWPLSAPPDLLLEVAARESRPGLTGRVRDADVVRRVAWLATAHPFDRARADAWLRLLLLEVSMPGERSWTVRFAGLRQQTGLIGEGELSLALFADPQERLAFATKAIESAAALAAIAERRPVGLLRRTGRAVARSLIRWPAEGAPQPLSAASPSEAIALLADLARWFRNRGALDFAPAEHPWDRCLPARAAVQPVHDDARMYIASAADSDLRGYYPENSRAWGGAIPDPSLLQREGGASNGSPGGASVLMSALANDAPPALLLGEIVALATWLGRCPAARWHDVRSQDVPMDNPPDKQSEEDEEGGVGFLEAERRRWADRDRQKGPGLLFKTIDDGALPAQDKLPAQDNTTGEEP